MCHVRSITCKSALMRVLDPDCVYRCGQYTSAYEGKGGRTEMQAGSGVAQRGGWGRGGSGMGSACTTITRPAESLAGSLKIVPASAVFFIRESGESGQSGVATFLCRRQLPAAVSATTDTLLQRCAASHSSNGRARERKHSQLLPT